MSGSSSEPANLAEAIAALESQRGVLGDELTDEAIASLRDRHAALTGSDPHLRQVSAVFVDVVGSTELSTRLDAEDTGELINELLDAFTRTVQVHGGRVFNYTGDGLLAVFGADRARENEAEWAVRAGLALIRETGAVSERAAARYGLDRVDVRVGISTGQASLGGSVERDRGIRGQAVNTAARMQEAAPVGGLRISHETQALVRGAFEVTEEPPLLVKGISTPLRTYLVHREAPASSDLGMARMGEVDAPMVGRAGELATLQSAFLRLFDLPGLAAVTVVADGGLGKSRLLYEFDRWASARPEAATIIWARASRQTRQRPFGLLRDALTGYLGIADNESPAVARQRYLEGLGVQAQADGGEAAAHLLGHLLGLDFADSPHVARLAPDPEQIRARGLAAARRAIVALAAHDPLVVVLEDAHWADDETLWFLDDLARRPVDGALLILASARPALDERQPHWLAAGSHVRIELQPLTDHDAAALAAVLLDRVAPDERAPLHEALQRADGNPYFMEEIVQMLLDNGGLVDDGTGTWTVGRLAFTQVPPTLSGVLQARLDSLDPSHRTALQQASVIGFRFWDEAVRAVDRRSVPALVPLADRTLIRPEGATVIPGAREFTFKHQLLQQFTYDSVLKRDRRAYHARAARWLASLVEHGRGDLLGATGDHFERAGEPAQAAVYFASAAEAARGRDARGAAYAYASRGLDLAGVSHETRWRLLAAREAVLAVGGDADAHRADLDALEQVADVLGDDRHRADAALRLAVAQLDWGEHLDGEATAHRAIELAVGAEAWPVVAVALAELARAARRTNRNEEARRFAEASLARARDLNDRRLEVLAMAELAAAQAALGEFTEDRALCERALVLARQIGDLVLEARLLNSLGAALFVYGEVGEARQKWQAAVELSRQIEWGYGEAIASLNLAGLATAEGRNEDALTMGAVARRSAEAGGWRDLEAAASLHVGIAAHRCGDLDGARSALVHSRDLFLANAGPHYALDPVAALALVELDEGNAEAALGNVDRVLAYASSGGSFTSLEEPYRVRLDCFTVLDRIGDPRATDVLREAHASMMEAAAALAEPDRDRWLRANPYQRALLDAWAARPA